MHRATPLNTSFRAYSAGGARSVVDKADDKKQMQEMGGNFMKGETRDKVEAPQNYGFTSVVMPATKGKDGQIEDSAEAFISFMGGNRSFPVCGVMDDRRFRLKELEPGDVAFFDHLQHQFHFNKDGGFLTGRDDLKLRFQLVEKPQDDQQQSGGSKAASDVSALATGGTGGQSGGQQKKKGQTKRYQKESKKFVDINPNTTDIEHDKKINVKSGGPVVITGSSISHKGISYFNNDVHIMGKLYVMQGFKPGNDLWEGGTPSGGPSLLNDSVADDPAPLSEGARAYIARKQAHVDALEARLAQMEARIAELEAKTA